MVDAGDVGLVHDLLPKDAPGLGKELSARVIFHEGRYAGTWRHGKFGGHMWGRIEAAEAPSSAPASEEPAAAPE